MDYDRHIRAIVAEKFARRAGEREALVLARKAEVYKAVPRIKEIEDTIMKTGFELLGKVLKNKTTSRSAAARIEKLNRELAAERERLLLEAGFPKDYLWPKFECEKCSDRGYIGPEQCECFRREMVRTAFGESNMSALLEKQTFKNLRLSYYSDKVDKKQGISSRENMENIVKTCREFVDNFDKSPENLLLYGPSGLGKTFLSSAIANEVLRMGHTVLYYSAGDLFNILNNLHFNRSDDPARDEFIARRVMDVRLLILDDLGTEFGTLFTITELFKIINHRLITGLKTIISTNLNMDELKNMYSERILSRIIGGYTLLRFFGEDVRIVKYRKA